MTPPVLSLPRSNSIRRNRQRTPGSGPRQRLFSPPVSDKAGISGDGDSGGGGIGRGDLTTLSPRNRSQKKRNRNSLEIEDIPTQVVPRGIAARTNGMEEFLSALKRGVVVRRHRPNAEAAFVKLFSTDGGDTVRYRYIPPDEAMIAFKEQAVRFNRSNPRRAKRDRGGINQLRSASNRWSSGAIGAGGSRVDTAVNTSDQEDLHRFNLPDFIAAERYREAKSKSKGAQARQMARVFLHSGEIRAADLVAVHPAIHPDPYGSGEATGTWSLRASPSEHLQERSFSLVLPGALARMKGHRGARSTKALGERWYGGDGSETSFRYLDIETATEGEYWVIFRGFLLLHRDASTGRFARDRVSGNGSNYNRRELEQMKRQKKGGRSSFEAPKEGNTLVHEVKEPPSTRPLLGRVAGVFSFAQGSDHIQADGSSGRVAPPPSDYFLGFKSSGTQIWSRLRQAGLETQRIYAVDKRKVMIKIRCPPDRLMDVAEVLRLKLKTRDGTYSAFREAMISHFVPTEDGLATYHPSHGHGVNPFRSSERQTMIDFIIRSRIRDSGAELGERTGLGKAIEHRVPLHMHARLEGLYGTWVNFWKICNWTDGRDGRSMSVGPVLKSTPERSVNNQSCDNIALALSHSEDTNSRNGSLGGNSDGNTTGSQQQYPPPPSFLTRFFVGSFYQPLDSIEQYYGEKIAFYFAWLQHSSYHLVFLSFLGVIVFIVQAATGRWDHPIRPFFSLAVMLWSFVVMVTWRKRSSFLAHRWGTLNYEEEETTRPQFKGVYRQDEITREWVVHYPKWKRWLKYCISFPLTIAFTVVSMLGILMLYANRDIVLARYMSEKTNLNESTFELDVSIESIGRKSPTSAVRLDREHLRDPKFWLIIGGFPSILGLSLPLLNFILMRISRMLNEFENYRTESEYRNHLIVKVFSFRFVCYFAALYYYAFIATSTDKEGIDSSILRVGTTLLIYITIAHWWTYCLSIYFPLLLHRWRIYRERLGLREGLRKLVRAEDEYARLCPSKMTDNDRRQRRTKLVNSRLLLEQAQSHVWEEMMLPSHDSFPEYVQAVITFAYVTCFSVVFPLTPLICLINHLLSMRLDAYKLCRGRRRPLAEKTGGIGVWEHVLHIVTVIAVLTNCALMAMTNSMFRWVADKLGGLALLCIVVGWEHVMLLIKYVMQASFSRFPRSVIDSMRKDRYEMTRKRTSYMKAKKERRSSIHFIENNGSSEEIIPSKLNPKIDDDQKRLGSKKEASRRHPVKDTSHHNLSPMLRQDEAGLETIPSISDTDDSPLIVKTRSSHDRVNLTPRNDSGDTRMKESYKLALGDKTNAKFAKGIYSQTQRKSLVDPRQRVSPHSSQQNATNMKKRSPLPPSKLEKQESITLKNNEVLASMQSNHQIAHSGNMNSTPYNLHSDSNEEIFAGQRKDRPSVESPFGMYYPSQHNGTSLPAHTSSLNRNDIDMDESIVNHLGLEAHDADASMVEFNTPGSLSRVMHDLDNLEEQRAAEKRIAARLNSEAGRFVDHSRRGRRGRSRGQRSETHWASLN